MQKSILIVEDEAITALSLRHELIRLGYKVGPPAASGEEAIERALREKPSCILMDINLIGGMSGIDAAALIREASSIPIIYMTGYSNGDMKTSAMSTHPITYLVKPVDAIDVDHWLKTIK